MRSSAEKTSLSMILTWSCAALPETAKKKVSFHSGSLPAPDINRELVR
jgi:hypothetical protein